MNKKKNTINIEEEKKHLQWLLDMPEEEDINKLGLILALVGIFGIQIGKDKKRNYT